MLLPSLVPRRPAILLLLLGSASAALLLDEDFSCASIGCNATHGITNYSYWRWSTTGSAQSSMAIGQAGGGRAGNAVSFHVDWCPPPDPNPRHLGCYRSELALQRAVQDTLIDWRPGVGSSERWLGFSNRLRNFTYDAVGNGPSFQLHGGGGLPTLKGLHPNLNLRVEGRNCSQSNRSCPVWELGVSHGDGAHGQRCGDDWPSCWRLGPALGAEGRFDGWNDWVVHWRGSPDPALGFVEVWRNGKLVLPKQTVATAYNDTVPPYLKFGVYRGAWKGATRPTFSTSSTIEYGGLKVGDAASSFAEVSTAQHAGAKKNLVPTAHIGVDMAPPLSTGRDSAEARAMGAAARPSSGPEKHTRLLKTDEARTSLVPRKPPAEIAPFPPMQWHSW